MWGSCSSSSSSSFSSSFSFSFSFSLPLKVPQGPPSCRHCGLPPAATPDSQGDVPAPPEPLASARTGRGRVQGPAGCHKGEPCLPRGVTKGALPVLPCHKGGRPRLPYYKRGARAPTGAGSGRWAPQSGIVWADCSLSLCHTPAVLGGLSLRTQEVTGHPHRGPVLVTRSAAATPDLVPWGTPTSPPRLSCSRS